MADGGTRWTTELDTIDGEPVVLLCSPQDDETEASRIPVRGEDRVDRANLIRDVLNALLHAASTAMEYGEPLCINIPERRGQHVVSTFYASARHSHTRVPHVVTGDGRVFVRVRVGLWKLSGRIPLEEQ